MVIGLVMRTNIPAMNQAAGRRRESRSRGAAGKGACIHKSTSTHVCAQTRTHRSTHTHAQTLVVKGIVMASKLPDSGREGQEGQRAQQPPALWIAEVGRQVSCSRGAGVEAVWYPPVGTNDGRAMSGSSSPWTPLQA